MSKKRQTLTENALWSARMALRMSVCKQFVYTIICECLKSTGPIQTFLPSNFSIFPTHFQLISNSNTVIFEQTQLTNKRDHIIVYLACWLVRTLLCGLIEIPTALCWSLYRLHGRSPFSNSFPTPFQLSPSEKS